MTTSPSPAAAHAVDDEPPEHIHKPPVTVAGSSWQGLDVVNQEPSPEVEQDETPSNDDEDDDDDDDENKCCTLYTSLAARYSRTHHIFWKVLLPLFFIIALCFLCGYFLVLLESNAEMNANDAALADIANRIIRIEEIAQVARNAPSVCLDLYQGDLSNRTQLEEHMQECGQRLPDRVNETLTELMQEFQVFDVLAFDWIFCGENRNMAAQVRTVDEAWEGQMESLTKQNEAKGMNETQARIKAIEEASGHDTAAGALFWLTAAGALFWLTVSTTIGYGNTVPITRGGRALVYTLGLS